MSNEPFGDATLIKIPESSKVIVFQPTENDLFNVLVVDIGSGQHRKIRNKVNKKRAETLLLKLFEKLKEHGASTMFKGGERSFAAFVELIKLNIK